MHYDKPVEDQSITAVASSILQHYGSTCDNPSLSYLDELLLSPPRNICLLLLDGLGYDILLKHTKSDSFFRKQFKRTLSSVFPPTTAAAATALETGLFPSQSGWLGWTVFWEPFKTNVALFKDTSDQGEPLPYSLKNTRLSVKTVVQQLKELHIEAFSTWDDFKIRGGDFRKLREILPQITQREGQRFIYGYLNNPDHILHKLGCESIEIAEWIHQAEADLETLTKQCPQTLFIVTADHGFTDIEGVCLEDFPELADTLQYNPSIEPRAMNLFVKPGRDEEFLHRFHEATQGTYRIFTKAEVLQFNLFGPTPHHPDLIGMVGDYLAVATDQLTLFPNREYMESMVATHGGLTQAEMTVPLIIWRTS